MKRSRGSNVPPPYADAVAYARRWPTVLLRSLDGTLLRRLSDGMVLRAWSNDGRRLVLMGGTHDLAVLEVWRVG